MILSAAIAAIIGRNPGLQKNIVENKGNTKKIMGVFFPICMYLLVRK